MTSATEMPPRHAKGKRPQFFETDGVDEAMSMILVLASEFCTMRERLDAVERIAERKGIILQEEIENFEDDEASCGAREERRSDFFEWLYYLTLKKAEEQQSGDSAERYSEVLDEIASD
jgi:hypothetical protein